MAAGYQLADELEQLNLLLGVHPAAGVGSLRDRDPVTAFPLTQGVCRNLGESGYRSYGQSLHKNPDVNGLSRYCQNVQE